MIPSPALHEYGIHTEQSDIRAHVSVVCRTIYVFKTESGRAAIREFSPPLRQAYQEGVAGATAEGWIVGVGMIPDIRRLRFDSWPEWPRFFPSLSTSEKGAMAVRCVISAMKLGRFPFWLDAAENDDHDIQVSGTDIIVACNQRIQVKCDFRGGDPPGTGNLFLQRAERNPLRRY